MWIKKMISSKQKTLDMTTEVNAAITALLVDEETRNDSNGSITYFLGRRQDRMFVATNVSVTIESKLNPRKKVVLDKNRRWVQFMALLPYIDEEAKQLQQTESPGCISTAHWKWLLRECERWIHVCGCAEVWCARG